MPGVNFDEPVSNRVMVFFQGYYPLWMQRKQLQTQNDNGSFPYISLVLEIEITTSAQIRGNKDSNSWACFITSPRGLELPPIKYLHS